jgi:hypothetical protein
MAADHDLWSCVLSGVGGVEMKPCFLPVGADLYSVLFLSSAKKWKENALHISRHEVPVPYPFFAKSLISDLKNRPKH